MTVYAQPKMQEPIGDVEGDNTDGFYAVRFGTGERVGPYTQQQGAIEFLARDAPVFNFTIIKGSSS
jgi:hypothetical protein